MSRHLAASAVSRHVLALQENGKGAGAEQCSTARESTVHGNKNKQTRWGRAAWAELASRSSMPVCVYYYMRVYLVLESCDQRIGPLAGLLSAHRRRARGCSPPAPCSSSALYVDAAAASARGAGLSRFLSHSLSPSLSGPRARAKEDPSVLGGGVRQARAASCRRMVASSCYSSPRVSCPSSSSSVVAAPSATPHSPLVDDAARSGARDSQGLFRSAAATAAAAAAAASCGCARPSSVWERHGSERGRKSDPPLSLLARLFLSCFFRLSLARGAARAC